MKTKFLLTLLALTGLLLGANSASASTGSHHNVASLSQKISTLIDLDPTAQSLVKLAIDRALIAQNKDSDKTPVDTRTTGAMVSGVPNKQPTIRGRVAKPNRQPIINGKIANPNPQPSEPPLINGLIVNPNRK
jgi:hypothetical protein